MRRRGSGFPPAHPSVEMLMACRQLIVSTLVVCGIMQRDLDDLVQIVLMAAWKAIDTGRYRPDPTADPARTFRSWLMGIAWRQAMHHRARAHHRREVPAADPWRVAPEPCTDPDVAALSAEVFVALWSLPLWAREVLLLAAAGHRPFEIARILRISYSAAAKRLRRARERLARLVRR